MHFTPNPHFTYYSVTYFDLSVWKSFTFTSTFFTFLYHFLWKNVFLLCILRAAASTFFTLCKKVLKKNQKNANWGYRCDMLPVPALSVGNRHKKTAPKSSERFNTLLLFVRLDGDDASVGIVLKFGELNASSVVDTVGKLAVVVEKVPLALILND